MFEENYFENVLKSLRVKRGKVWTQAKMAESLGVSLRTYRAWEIGESLPAREDLRHLTALLALSDIEIETLFRAANQAAPTRQNLPFARNPFFTGRQSLLEQLRQLFEQNARIAITQPISVNGLGGIGKTQIALEYAHRWYPKVYRSVLFVNAESLATLSASYLSLAQLLQLPEQHEQDAERIVQAVKNWLQEHNRWLLILDNADDLCLVRAFLPTRSSGHILFTTRSQIVGNVATPIQVEAMSPQEGLLFLLRRCGILKSHSDLANIAADTREAAAELVEVLAGHPLALDQAGAYIEETTDASAQTKATSFREYREIFQQYRHILLKRRGLPLSEHPESVATTFEISMKKASELDPRCADVLTFCSLLHPDAIPEELLSQETGLNLKGLDCHEVIAALRRYSLIKRDGTKKVVSLHRLVQAVIRDDMQAQQFHQYSSSVVQAVSATFPEVTFETWSKCERYLPHVLVCANWIERAAIATPQASHLLQKAGSYLRDRGQYALAEPLLLQALRISEQHMGAKHLNTAQCLNDLTDLYYVQGRYTEAELLCQRALSIREEQLGPTHPDAAHSINTLAVLYECQGRYSAAEPLYQRALSIREEHLGPMHLDTAQTINDLAVLYHKQGRDPEAEPLSIRALTAREKHLGPTHPNTATSLNNVALVYESQGRYSEAEPLYERALSIWEEHLGPTHPYTATGLSNLAELYKLQGKYVEAERLHERALSIWEEHLGPMHPNTAVCLNNLALVYESLGRYSEAGPMHERALSIWEERLGSTHPYTAIGLGNLAKSYIQQKKYAQAEPLLLRSLSIFEQQLGVQHPHTAKCLGILADLYQRQGKHAAAEPLLKRVLSIREQALGETHDSTEKIP